MHRISLFLISALILSVAFYSCKSSGDDGVIIQGKVINQQSREPIFEALVQISSPAELSNTFTRTDSTGNYSLGALDILEISELTITVSAPNFLEVEKPLKVTPEDKVTGFNFELSTGDGGGTNTPTGTSEGAATIALSNLSKETINIAATGGETSSVITFEVQDSLGNSIDIDHAVDVYFSITSGPNGGESITPEKVRTDAKGLAKAVLNSGNKAGVVKIEARIERTVPKINSAIAAKNFSAGLKGNTSNQFSNEPGTGLNSATTPSRQQKSSSLQKSALKKDIVIISKPVAITIHGGFPDAGNFSISTNSLNQEFLSELEVGVSVQVGDEFNNPVKPGTAVYFTTTNGLIEGSANGHTDDDGKATVLLTPKGTGSTTITATTVDKNSQEITKSIDLLFTSSKATITTSDEVSITKDKKVDLNYVVTDKHNNPMAPKTTIEVSTEAALVLSGRVSTILGEEVAGGTDITTFKFSISAKEEFTGSDNVVITVTSASGVVTKEFITVTSTESGTDGGTVNVPGDPEAPASMELVSLSNETINIAESGGITNTAFTFQVQDSAGRNLDAQSQAEVAFSILTNPGGANITPTSATTDAQGRVTSNLNAGNTAGVVQIQAQVVGTSIKSKPVAVTVHGGFPVQSNFSLSASARNHELLDDLRIPIHALLGDAFSNPVKPGTAVYFETDNGVIDGSAKGHTDDKGNASVELNPASLGTATVTASTVDQTETDISATYDLLFTTSKATISSSFNNTDIILASDEQQTVDFSVSDKNSQPMASGTTVSVATDNQNLSLSGDLNQTIEDALTGGEGITDFSFKVTADELFSGSSNVVIQVSSPSGVVSTQNIVVSKTTGSVPGDPEAPASMELVSLSNETINIAESGGITNTAFTFQVQDSAGRNLDAQSQVEVAFSILANPGGANITPTSATTDAQGRVTSNLNAGNTAGVVQIQAQVAGTSIKSKPVAVTVHGGFPDSTHFTLEPLTNTNIEGFNRNGVEITYKVRLGDEFSNPVKPGTAVYFKTDGGLIEGSSTGHTDEVGYAEVKLFAGNPRPTDGKGTVTATTTDKDGNQISKTSPFIFSTSKADITTDINELTLSPGSKSNAIDYKVKDLNGNPMPAGTQINVTATGSGLQLSGDTEVMVPNDLATGIGITDFEFSVTAGNDLSGSEKVIIKTISPAGVVTTNQDLKISSTGGGVSGPPSGAASLILESVQRETINIKETGGIVNTAFTFQVQDSSGRPLNMDNPVEVGFEIINGPGGGEGVLPEKATTNSTGRVTSNLFSGNKAGVVMLQATITRTDIGLTLHSKPVAITIHGGFPDANHFSIKPLFDNFGGYDRNGIENTIEVIVGDKFSNPVKPGTAVYFETTGGIIEGNGIGHTDNQGRVSVKLISADPRPSETNTVDGTSFGGRVGLAKITAKTINESNVLIEKSTDVVFSTNSAIITANKTTFDLDPNGGDTFDYTVTDLNGNPMPAGTEISIKAGDGIEVTGSSSFVMGDHLFPGAQATEFSFSIRDTDDENSDPAALTLLISVTAPNGNTTIYDGITGTRRKAIPAGTKSNKN